MKEEKKNDPKDFMLFYIEHDRKTALKKILGEFLGLSLFYLVIEFGVWKLYLMSLSEPNSNPYKVKISLFLIGFVSIGCLALIIYTVPSYIRYMKKYLAYQPSGTNIDETKSTVRVLAGELTEVEAAGFDCSKILSKKFVTSILPKGALQIEFDIMCRNDHQAFTQKSTHNFNDVLEYSTKRVCPHCSLNYSINVDLRRNGSHGEGEIKLVIANQSRFIGLSTIDIGLPLICPTPIEELALLNSKQKDNPFTTDLSALSEIAKKDKDPLVRTAAVAKITELIVVNPQYAKEGWTPLMHACQKNNDEVVDILLLNESNIDYQNYKRLTAIHLASFFGFNSIVKKLISAGANINVQMEDKSTPLHLAAQTGHPMVVKTLIDAGCDINLLKTDNSTALMVAVGKKNSEIIKLLRDAGTKNPPWMLTCYSCNLIWTSPSRLLKYEGKPQGAQSILIVGDSSATDRCKFCGSIGE